MARLFRELEKLKEKAYYPFHMPGHKRNVDGFLKDAYDIDITEIDGFDNLHDAKEIIKEAEDNAANMYKSEETHFLVNGSTCGILSAIAAVTNKGDKIIVARNCHKSVYNALFLNELQPVFIYPETKEDELFCLSITSEQVEEALKKNSDAKAVVIVSPTYDGVISDIAKIANVVHGYNIPLIVDEAHGAHFFLENRSAVINGADIVINSVHKTLNGLTQTALIHINGSLVDRAKLREYLTIYQTSSPSYVLMSSIDYALYELEKNGTEIYRDYTEKIKLLKEGLCNLKNLKHITRDSLNKQKVYDFDEGKIIISTVNANISGKALSKIISEHYGLIPEMSMEKYVLFMVTLSDSYEGINRLIDALTEIDKDIEGYSKKYIDDEKKEKIVNTLKGHANEISGKTVYSYPPGIPVIVKGEVITEEIIKRIDEYIDANLDVKGL